ncbi:MAG: hypothetical protein CML23_12495 [Rhizobiaceae bacterium]|nr:hypothetical protein [Rhizobiaceae bacterium]
MEDIFGALFLGLSTIFTVKVLTWTFVGIVAGMFFGLIPGLSGLTGMGLLLPFAIGQPPEVAFSFLLGMYAVTTQTDAIPAVLLGIPGTSAAQATYLDGYPMAKRGEAGRALAASYFASIVGTIVFSAIFLVLLPVIRPIINSFGSPEFFMLAMMGLVMAASLVGPNLPRGLMVASAGLLISCIGIAGSTGDHRYTLGTYYLEDGMPIVPVALGLFAVPEVMELMIRRSPIAHSFSAVGGAAAGLRDTIRHGWLVVRCSIIGGVCGVIPGLGGSAAEWLGYSHAVQTARDKSQFGKGDIRGVLSAEAATTAQKPGAIIPTVALGIPGNASMAVMLGVFLIVGLRPGSAMLNEQLPLTFQMLWTVILANIVVAIICLVLQRYIVKLCQVRASIIAPLIIAFMAIGATFASNSFGDLVAFAVFGALGLFMKAYDWPRVPLLIGMVLGEIAEPNFFISVQVYGASWLWQRPIVLATLVVMLAFLLTMLVRRARGRAEIRGGGADA